ncbi:MAG: NlpC/P60 family protein [Planctomycetaceae bacterium]
MRVDPGVLVALLLLGTVMPVRGSDSNPDPRDVATWIARCPEADCVVVDAAAVARHNRRMLDLDPSVNDLAALPPTLDRAAVVDRVRRRGTLPKGPLVFGDGRPVSEHHRDGWAASLALDDVPDTVAVRFGLVVRRSALRRFPTHERVHASARATDIDQFQESAFFPGTPVAAVHATPDGTWSYVIGPTYDAWMESDAIGFGARGTVLAYADEASRVVVAARAETAFVPDMPAISRLTLDMGTTLVEDRGWPPHDAVHGQSPAAGHVVRLPTRAADGTLRLVPALVPRSAGTRDGPLPATRATVLRQAFAFLGERYGWGHDFSARDCSGFVGDVYRSLGILLPRNTRDQAVSPALEATPIPAEMHRGEREAAVRSLLPGDLVFTGRHVMMVVGHDEHSAWVIHDTHDGLVDGVAANGVVVQTFQSVDGGRALDAVTAVVRVLPATPSSSEKSP